MLLKCLLNKILTAQDKGIAAEDHPYETSGTLEKILYTLKMIAYLELSNWQTIKFDLTP